MAGVKFDRKREDLRAWSARKGKGSTFASLGSRSQIPSFSSFGAYDEGFLKSAT